MRLRPARWLPGWLSGYRSDLLPGDLTAGAIVTVMLIPQGLAYAVLAGLPPQVGLYASILPLFAYALFGSSMTLAVGPVAVVSLMTASALQPLAAPGSSEYIALAVQLALLSGALLFLFGLLRLGFLADLLSHPVVSGFTTGSAILIVLSQVGPLLGGDLFPAPEVHPATSIIGVATLAFLFAARAWLPGLLARFMPVARADLLARLAPMAAVILATAVTAAFRLDTRAGVSVVGPVPSGLPTLGLPLPGWSALSQLWVPALLISLVGFVESVSVGRSLGQKRRQRIDPDREFLGLGAGNVASALSGGLPVTGGFSRSVVNFAAGANTPLAGIVSALLMAGLVMGLTGLFRALPLAVLAATIIAAVASLVDLETIRHAWRYDRREGVILLATLTSVVFVGVEAGVLVGVSLSLAMLVWRSSRPHIAVIGRVPGTEHFRNVERHAVETLPGVMAVRIDESLFFGNASAVAQRIEQLLAAHPEVRRLLLVFSAVNFVDATALGVLADLEEGLRRRGITLYLAEVKGPLMDRLARDDFGARLRERVFFSTHEAFRALASPAVGKAVRPDP